MCESQHDIVLICSAKANVKNIPPGPGVQITKSPFPPHPAPRPGVEGGWKGGKGCSLLVLRVRESLIGISVCWREAVEHGSLATQKKDTAEMVRALSHALQGGLGYDLNTYKPVCPLRADKELVLNPADPKLRHMLILDSDEGPTEVAKSSFLFSRRGAGLRGVCNHDYSHRVHNNWDLACKTAGFHGTSNVNAHMPCQSNQHLR